MPPAESESPSDMSASSLVRGPVRSEVGTHGQSQHRTWRDSQLKCGRFYCFKRSSPMNAKPKMTEDEHMYKLILCTSSLGSAHSPACTPPKVSLLRAFTACA
eukprot:1756862-Pleurochrysis_carterae.AAC.1